MAGLDLSEELPSHTLAVNLRRAFSGIVSGNIREETIAMVEANGPFELRGSPRVAALLDELLRDFVAETNSEFRDEYLTRVSILKLLASPIENVADEIAQGAPAAGQ